MVANKMITWLRSFLPALVQISHWERLRSSIGALIGIILTGGLTGMLFGPTSNIPLLVAPIGASAVLLFAVPASPLAQPWSLIGGNVIAAVIGVTCGQLISDPILAAAVALALSIMGMFFFRCVHPPSGAVALTAVLGGPAIHALGYQFVIAPIGINSLLLLGIAILYHRITGHRYPHTPHLATTQNAAAIPAATSSSHEIAALKADLQAVLKKRNEMLDIDVEDLEEVLKEVETHIYRRHMQGLDCASVMSSNVKSVTPDMTAASAWHLLHQHKIKAVPVIDEQQRVIGIVTQMDFVQHAIVREFADLAKFQSLETPSVSATSTTSAGSTLLVKDIMSAPVKTALVTQALADLVPLFSYYGHHHLPVVDADQKLKGIVTQANIVQGLYQKALDKTRIVRN